MNWKNVLLLVSVDVKSYRLVRGSRFRRFRENKLVTYALYVAAWLIGILIGWLVGNFYSGVSDSAFKELIFQGAAYFFISLPTLSLLYGLVFTQMNKIQRIGVKVSIQPLYWFPITWEEHTLASILASILGTPLIITIFISSSIFVASLFLGLVPLAVFTILALLATAILASATTEILKSLQVRLTGAVTKVAGRAAIWLRLLGSILFFIVFYLIYFSLYYNVTPVALIESIAGVQSTLWFIPYLWPGMALSSFISNLALETVVFSLASLVFIYALFLAAVRLNMRFGLYEAPSIRISRGVYVPRVGLLGRLGFSPVEAAIIRKDFRSFTRRSELMYIFIFPIVFIIMPLIVSMRSDAASPSPSGIYSFMFAYLTLLPGALMATILGSSIVGSEGGSIGYLYSLPLSAKSLVKAKHSFATLFSLAVGLICSVIGGLLIVPSVEMVAIGLIEGIFLTFSLAMVSLAFGIRGADFREFPRPRMIRPKWGFINIIVCVIVGLAVVSPMIPYVLRLIFETSEGWLKTLIGAMMPASLPEYYLYIAIFISGIVAAIITYMFHKIAVNNAEQLLAKAEV